MKNTLFEIDLVETDVDDIDKFEFEEQDDLREFFEEDYDSSDTRDLLT